MTPMKKPRRVSDRGFFMSDLEGQAVPLSDRKQRAAEP